MFYVNSTLLYVFIYFFFGLQIDKWDYTHDLMFMMRPYNAMIMEHFIIQSYLVAILFCVKIISSHESKQLKH